MPRRLVLSLEPTLLKLKLVSPKGTITLVSIALLKAILGIFSTGTYAEIGTKSVSSMKMLWKEHTKKKRMNELVLRFYYIWQQKCKHRQSLGVISFICWGVFLQGGIPIGTSVYFDGQIECQLINRYFKNFENFKILFLLIADIKTKDSNFQQELIATSSGF